MADKKRGVSDTFGRYTENGKGRVAGPKNITSDMWTPISTGRSEDEAAEAKKAPQKKTQPAPAKKEPQKKKNASSQSAQKQSGLISEGRKSSADGKKADKKVKKKKKAPKRSRIPQGRPISEMDGGRTEGKKKKKPSDTRRHQQLSRAERDYEDGIREGKSPGELSKERAGYKRKRRVRQNIIIIAVFLVFALAFAGVYTYSKGAPVGVITVEGDSIYTYEQIVSAAGLEIGENMLSLKEGDINARVSSALPYIDSVQVKKKLPDKVILTVTSTSDKLIFVNKAKDSIVTDDNGKILRDGKGVKLADGLFRVYGVEWESSDTGTVLVPTADTKEKYELAVKIAETFEKEGVILRGTVNVSDMSDIRVYHKNGNTETMIYLGRHYNVEERVSFACEVFSVSAIGKSGYINARSDAQIFYGEGTL